ncbi:MAG TPA: lysozyme [Acidimicrobiales bacterium]|nr:lysozyme [Acidimicrobiales bacterium]
MEAAVRIALDELRTSEGYVAYVYDDKRGRRGRLTGPGECRLEGGQYKVKATGGTATVGYGETRPDVLDKYWNATMSEAEAFALLAQRVEQDFYRPIRSMISVPLSARQWAALVHFTYNVGVRGFRDSTLCRVINEGADYGSVRDGKVRAAFMMWLKPPELRGRREKEVAMFFDTRPITTEQPEVPLPPKRKDTRMFFFWHDGAVYLAAPPWRSPHGLAPAMIDPLVAAGVPIIGNAKDKSGYFAMLSPERPK